MQQLPKINNPKKMNELKYIKPLFPVFSFSLVPVVRFELPTETDAVVYFPLVWKGGTKVALTFVTNPIRELCLRVTRG